MDNSIKVFKDELDALDRELKDGDLTEKGYFKKAKPLKAKLIQAEFDEGYLTKKGFDKKMKELDDNYTAIGISQALHTKTTNETLKKLFKSAAPATKGKGKGTRKKGGASYPAVLKKSDLCHIQGQHHVVDSSAKSVNIVNPSIPSTRKHYIDIDEGNPSKKRQIDSQTDKLHDNFDWTILEVELKDRSLHLSYKEDSLSFMTKKSEDDDFCNSIKREKNDTLLCRNNMVDCWIDCLKESKESTLIPKLVRNYYVVPPTLMSSFDKFSDEYRKLPVNGCLRKKNEIIKLWISEKDIQIIDLVVLNGIEYAIIPFELMDDLCEWLNEAINIYL